MPLKHYHNLEEAMVSSQFVHSFAWASWSSILAGVVTALALSIVLAVLGVALGFTVIKPKSDDPVSGLGVAFGVWSGVSVVISLAGGGFMAGLLSGMHGAEHGFLVWAVVLLTALFCGGNAIASAVSLMGSAVKTAGSGAAGLMAGIGKGTADLTASAWSGLQEHLNLHVDTSALNDQITSVMRDTGIETLQPDYLHGQLGAIKTDMGKALRRLSLHPTEADAVIKEFLDAEKDRLTALTGSIDVQSAVRGLMTSRNIPQEEAEQLVNNAMQAYDATVEKARQTLADLRAQVQEGKERLALLTQEAREKADAMASMAAKAALAAALALILGALISMGAAYCGSMQAESWMIVASQPDIAVIR